MHTSCILIRVTSICAKKYDVAAIFEFLLIIFVIEKNISQTFYRDFSRASQMLQ